MTTGAIPTATAATPCPRCGAATNGRFCAECGTPVTGVRCRRCDTGLSATAKYCHRCGTPTVASGRTAPLAGNTTVPWAIAVVCALLLVAVIATNRFAEKAPATAAAAPGGAGGAPVAGGGDARGGGRPPDLNSMTPKDAADRLFDRVMRLKEEGKRDSVRFFAPMALSATANVQPADADLRFHLGAIAIATEDSTLALMARAQADTILAARPTHLLGLILGVQSSAIRGDDKARRDFQRRLLDASGKELALPLDEYLQHRPVIDDALRTARATP
jgi:hypothetical protein